MVDLSNHEHAVLNAYQRDFPLVSRPFAAIGDVLGMSEAEVIAVAQDLQAKHCISRVGAVTRPNSAGASTLAAVSVPLERLEHVAALVSAMPEVNHNYEREHAFNLWFVVTAQDRAAVDQVLADVERKTGLGVIDLPLECEYHIDLGFAL